MRYFSQRKMRFNVTSDELLSCILALLPERPSAQFGKECRIFPCSQSREWIHEVSEISDHRNIWPLQSATPLHNVSWLRISISSADRSTGIMPLLDASISVVWIDESPTPAVPDVLPLLNEGLDGVTPSVHSIFTENRILIAYSA